MFYGLETVAETEYMFQKTNRTDIFNLLTTIPVEKLKEKLMPSIPLKECILPGAVHARVLYRYMIAMWLL